MKLCLHYERGVMILKEKSFQIVELNMPRDVRVHLDDMLVAADKIFTYVENMSLDDFEKDEKIIDAVTRNLAIRC